MSAAHHTPGPWRLTTHKITEGERVVFYGWSIVDAESKNVPFHSIDRSKQALANARLIAAAPDLLAALLTALDHIDMGALETSHYKDAAMIRAAIAKATGGAL